MKKTLLALGAALLCWNVLAAPVKPAQPAQPAKLAKPGAPTVAELLAASSAADWRSLAPESTLVMDLPSGPVVIELATAFAPKHAANIVALARAGYFDGSAVLRVQDNYVVQWGDEDDPEAAKSRPRPKPQNLPKIPAEFDRPLAGLVFSQLPPRDNDGWAPIEGFVDGWPVSANPKTGRAWLAECYGMVGAGRNDAADSSDGASLYAVIGPARALDLNITTVGRVLSGMERLAALPRGTGPMGFYATLPERTLITRVRVLADIPPAERPKLQVLRTHTPMFQRVLEARRHRDGWYLHSPERVDLCSALPPVRPVP